jgi:hypothetical protein
MEDFIEKLVNSGGSLMGRYEIIDNEIIFTSNNPVTTGTIILDEEKMETVHRNHSFVRLDYGQVEILFIASRKNRLIGSFTAGIMDIIIRGDRKTIVNTIISSLRGITLQKA